MSRLSSKIRIARQIVARSADGAAEMLELCAKSTWLALVCEHVPCDGADIARLSVSLYLAREHYLENALPLRELTAGDRQLRSDLRTSMKLLKDAEKTAGLFANAISVIRSGMQVEITKPPLFGDYASRIKAGTGNPKAKAKSAALAMVAQFTPKKLLKDEGLAAQVKSEAEELLRSAGFEIKQRN